MDTGAIDIDIHIAADGHRAARLVLVIVQPCKDAVDIVVAQELGRTVGRVLLLLGHAHMNLGVAVYDDIAMMHGRNAVRKGGILLA